MIGSTLNPSQMFQGLSCRALEHCTVTNNSCSIGTAVVALCLASRSAQAHVRRVSGTRRRLKGDRGAGGTGDHLQGREICRGTRGQHSHTVCKRRVSSNKRADTMMGRGEIEESRGYTSGHSSSPMQWRGRQQKPDRGVGSSSGKDAVVPRGMSKRQEYLKLSRNNVETDVTWI